MIVLIVMTDGRRRCIAETIPSLRRALTGRVTRRVIHDDSGDLDYREWLGVQFPDFELITTGARSGFGGAYANAWRWLSSHTAEPFVFSTEDDFTFNRPVDLDRLAGVLDQHPWLAQLALRRQPWNDAERAAGGIVEQHPRDYVECFDGDGNRWLEHRRFFTTNPCLYRRALLDVGWPEGAQSEGRFGIRLFAEGFDGVPGCDVQAGYWGARASQPWVHHIGDERAGTGY